MMKTLGEPAAARAKRSIQSIQLGFQIVRAVAGAAEPMTLSAIARAVDMAPSKAVLYLNSFCVVGLLAKDGATRYSLGPYALELGVAALNGADIVSAAREEMRVLREGKIFAAYLSVWGSQGAVIVAKDDKHPDLPMTIRLGHVLPLLSSATGHVYMAYLPREMTVEFARREFAESAVDPAAMEKTVKDVMRDGVASLRGHMNPGTVATAAPIFDREGAVAGVLTVLGPKPEGKARDHETARQLIRSARKVSASLGASADPG